MGKQNMIHIHSMEYLTIKRNGLLTHATPWINFDNMMVFERTLAPKDMILHDSIYMKCPKPGKWIDRKCVSSFQWLEKEKLKVTGNLHGASFAGKGNALRLDYGDDCTTQWYTEDHWIVHFQMVTASQFFRLKTNKKWVLDHDNVYVMFQ